MKEKKEKCDYCQKMRYNLITITPYGSVVKHICPPCYGKLPK
jgi:hypothetical protein